MQRSAGQLPGQWAVAEHPDGGEVHLKKGRFGPYIEHNKLRAPLPKGTDMASLSLDDALPLLAAKAAQPVKAKSAKTPKSKTKAAKKRSTKKSSAKTARAKT